MSFEEDILAMLQQHIAIIQNHPSYQNWLKVVYELYLETGQLSPVRLVDRIWSSPADMYAIPFALCSTAEDSINSRYYGSYDHQVLAYLVGAPSGVVIAHQVLDAQIYLLSTFPITVAEHPVQVPDNLKDATTPAINAWATAAPQWVTATVQTDGISYTRRPPKGKDANSKAVFRKVSEAMKTLQLVIEPAPDADMDGDEN